MSGKNVEGFALPPINLLREIDQGIQREIDCDETGTTQRVFNYYNSPSKPLNHREFIQFWASLSKSEMAQYYERFFR
jgi:hypothetical protein